MLKLPPEVARALYRLRRGQWPIALAFLILLVPGVAGRGPSRRVVVQCQDEDTALVDLDGGPARVLPQSFPKEWRRAPCPEGEAIRTVRGACFLATKERPPCRYGYEHDGECLLPGARAKPFPTSIQR